MDYICHVCLQKTSGVELSSGEYLEIQCEICGNFLDEIDIDFDFDDDEEEEN